MAKKINQLPTASITDNSLLFVGDAVSGQLFQTGYKAVQTYMQAGLVRDTGSLVTTASLNTLAATIFNDIGQLANTSSFNNYTASTNSTISNVFSSESNYLPTASYLQDSGSFVTRIANVFSSQSLYTQLSLFDSYTASLGIQVANVYASQSNYTLTSSFQTFSASVSSQMTGSVNTGSLLLTASFNAYTASINSQLVNVYASESNYTPTSSFNAFSSSYHVDSGSFLNLIASVSGSGGGVSTVVFQAFTQSINLQVANVYASESNYHTTASFNTFSASLAIQVGNIFASESNYTLTGSFNSLSASYHTDSGSFLALIASITGSGGGVSVLNFNSYTASANSQILNVFASESNYVLTASFNTFSSSVATQFANVTGSGGSTNTGSLLLTSSFNTYTASITAASNSIAYGNGTGITSSAKLIWNNSASFLIVTGSISSIQAAATSPMLVLGANGVAIENTTYNGTNVARTLVFGGFTFTTQTATNFVNFINGAVEAGRFVNGKLGIGGQTAPTASLSIGANTTASAQINLASGSTVSSPKNGDIWFDGANLNMQIGGSTTVLNISSSFNLFSSSVATQFSNITGSGGSTGSKVLNFIVGDGQSFTPSNGSTVFSSSLLVGHTVLQFAQEGLAIAPVSRSVAWYSVSSSIGQINLNNSSFVTDGFYSIIYS
jgi:hypothetical protein